MKDFELRLGKLGLTVFILGMSVALLVVFAFGVKVGKEVDTYPAKIVGIIPGLKGKILSRPADSEGKAPVSADSRDNFKLGFYESLKKGDGQDSLQDGQIKTSEEPAAPAAQSPENSRPLPQADAKPAPPGQAPASARQSTAAAEQKPPAAQPAAKAPPASSRFFIQVAALKDEAKAKALKAKLVKLGYAPKFEAIKREKGKLYRIRLTGYSSQEEASKALGRLEKQMTGTKCLIHREPQ